MPGQKGADGPANGAAEKYDTEQRTVRSDAEILGHHGRYDGEEAAVCQSVDGSEKKQHPRLFGDLQPKQTTEQHDEAYHHRTLSADPVVGSAHHYPTQHAHTANRRKNACGCRRRKALIGAMHHDMYDNRQQTEEDGELRQAHNP